MDNSHDSNKPVAWPCVIAEADFEKDTITLEMQCSDYMVRAGQHWLSTSPQPSKPWVSLTEEEAEDIWNRYCDEMGKASINDAPDITRAIEAKLREKNA